MGRVASLEIRCRIHAYHARADSPSEQQQKQQRPNDQFAYGALECWRWRARSSAKKKQFSLYRMKTGGRLLNIP